MIKIFTERILLISVRYLASFCKPDLYWFHSDDTNNIVSVVFFPSGWTLWINKAPHVMLPALVLLSYITTYQRACSTFEYNWHGPHTHYLSGLTHQECAKKEESREETPQRHAILLPNISVLCIIDIRTYSTKTVWSLPVGQHAQLT